MFWLEFFEEYNNNWLLVHWLLLYCICWSFYELLSNTFVFNFLLYAF